MDSDEEAGTAASLDHVIAGLQTPEAADQVRNASHSPVVVNVRSGVVLRVVGDRSNPTDWQTRCGSRLSVSLTPERKESSLDCGICLCRFVPRTSLP